jgi:co-chaperonin GroES (HSP10)
MKHIAPTKGYIVLTVEDGKTKVRPSGLTLVISNDYEPSVGKVIFRHMDSDYRINDNVLFPAHHGYDYELDSVNYRIVKESDILATIL